MHIQFGAPLFDVTDEDIEKLDDDDIRALVAYLCEAEVAALAESTVAVTWGGHQDAEDGGIDVRVSLPHNTSTSGFIPRSETGFQVKKPDMPRGI